MSKYFGQSLHSLNSLLSHMHRGITSIKFIVWFVMVLVHFTTTFYSVGIFVEPQLRCLHDDCLCDQMNRVHELLLPFEWNSLDSSMSYALHKQTHYSIHVSIHVCYLSYWRNVMDVMKFRGNEFFIQ